MTDHRPAIRLLPKQSPMPLRHGAVWAYADQLVLDRRTKALVPGTIVDLLDGEKRYVATGAFNPSSKIAFRVLERAEGVAIDREWLKNKIKRALELREQLYEAPFYRLIHAEADGLPGVVVDRFGATLVLQPNAAWAETMLDDLAGALRDVTGATGIWKSASGRARGLEGLDDASTALTGTVPDVVDVPMNGAIYRADLRGGQKTGLFYDQRENHAFAARLAASGSVLDVFSHVGGFALASLAAGAKRAVCVDGSAAALTLAAEGAAEAGFGDQFSTRQGDAFAEMDALAEEAATFDTVVCDPPAFAPAKSAVDAGLRAYERVARKAAPLVRSGGYLVLCSCSHAVDLKRFREVSLRGISKAGRACQLLHTGAAGPDHPVHPALAESAYLKAIFLRLS
ncbi:RSP_2647 family RNA methyltransferase [Algicella marina]|uniref:Methyltransferase domain-containing protein n=1 Tax=Algicella marina TaxID=2683284 RepID=A0A6P1SXH6_9RHOB|nr:class I SAM-dependent rRNA methyltransferase [Algicella marina]QHQ34467.1 methyltransferase domain-containing protein [Algicella marina]